MFREKILSETQWNCLDRVWLSHGEAACVGYRLAKMYLGAVAGSQVVLYIALFVQTHGGSSRSVACLKGARLKRSLECLRREANLLT